MFYRRANVVYLGVGIALGFVEPGMDYFKAISDGEQEAKLKKAQHDAVKGMSK